MTAIAISAGALPAALKWDTINWPHTIKAVRRLQMRIAKAFREGKPGKAKSLQWLLTHSLCAKLVAVRKVVQNRGSKTPGVDGVIWKTPAQKMQAVYALKRRGYRTQPLRRIYIPKKQTGQWRPLSIPAMMCRAQQALALLALEPIAETVADRNAYGFRPLRSTADAIKQCFLALSKSYSARFILEADIQGCFDNITHSWLRDNIPMDKVMLGKWLTAGYVEKGALHAVTKGTPQGGVISPTLLNLTLSGLEQAVKSIIEPADKVNVIVYADDFIITGATEEVLTNKVKPVVEAFLSERGLSLSLDKTRITTIEEGFDFLGMNVRKYEGKLLIQPEKSNTHRLLADIRGIIKRNPTATTQVLIEEINPKILGWANFYRHVRAKRTYRYVDYHVFKAIWRWAIRRHPQKGKRWIRQKYFRCERNRHWIFTAGRASPQQEYLDMATASAVRIKRHIKVRAAANPYDPLYQDYFAKRIRQNKTGKTGNSRINWWLCWWNLKAGSPQRGLIKA